MREKTDDELVQLARAGSAEAMEELYGRHRGPILRFALRMTGEPAAAEDVFQETFVHFFRRLDRYEPRGQLAAYLYRIARSFALDEKAAARRERGKALRPSPSAPEEGGDREALAGRAEQALQDLPPQLREVAVLRLYEDLDYARIAEIQGVSEATARSRMRYALEALRAALGAPDREENR
jgi:RNA polymerase sigma-70 factor (ECF subfamily)